MGQPARFDLARSGAPARSVGELLALAGPAAAEEYLGMSLDYGAGVGSDRLREAIAATCNSAPSDVVVTHGAVEALLLACGAAIGERRDIAVACPAYEGLSRSVEAAGASARRVSVWEPTSTHLDLGVLLELELTRYAAVVVNSPHNPTGLRAGRAELQALAMRCSESGTVLIVDEVSLGTLDPQAAGFSPATVGEAVVLVGDVSKAFGLGGLRVGWCITSCPVRRARIAELRDLTSLSNSTPGQFLAALALEHRERLSVSDLARANLEHLGRWMASIPGSRWVAPSDGLVAFCGLPFVSSSLSFAKRLSDTQEVSVTPGAFFGHDDHLRIGLGVPEADFAEGLRRLAEATDAGSS
jgi:aspartate/methionine/tyrosine aminotransferase